MHYTHVMVCTPPVFAGEGGIEPPTKFSKRERRLDRISTFGGGLLGKREGRGGGGCNFHIKNKLKSEIYNGKKSLSAKIFLYRN